MSTTSNKKNKTTAYTRAQEFPEDLEALSETVLMCKFCCYEVDWAIKSTVVDHVKGKKHGKLKMESDKLRRQMTIENTMSRQDKKQEIIFDFMEMMIEVNIPIEKKDKMEDWIRKYVPNGGCIPKSDTLRRDYMPKILEKHKKDIKEKIHNQPLAILLDSSPDRKARNVVNTIAVCGATGQRFLLNTAFLDSVNNTTLFHLLDSVRQD